MSRGSVRFLLSHYGYGRGYYSKAGARRSPLNLVTTHFDLSRNANRRRSDRKRSAKNTVNATFSEEPEEREGCDASGRTDIHPANPESQASNSKASPACKAWGVSIQVFSKEEEKKPKK